MSISIGYKRNNPFHVLTQYCATNTQFLKRLNLGYDVTMRTSFVVPCNLCPVLASLRFTGSCVVQQIKLIIVSAIWWVFTLTFGEFVSGFIVNTLDIFHWHSFCSKWVSCILRSCTLTMPVVFCFLLLHGLLESNLQIAIWWSIFPYLDLKCALA